MSTLLKIFSENSKIAGYKRNVGKNKIMAMGKIITHDPQQSFKWTTTNVKYLGCLISDNKQIHKDYFIPLLNNMKADLIKWNNLHRNLNGRVNLFRMEWLPKYSYSTLPKYTRS